MLSSSAPQIDKAELEREENERTIEQQKEVDLDLYGRRPDIEETPSFVEHKLVGLEDEISALPEKAAYDLACTICPKITKSDEFRILFLRADRFDEKKAAVRMTKYWEHKIKYFGEGRAFRKISLQDLTAEDQATLKKGGIQILPEKDNFGRGLIYTVRCNHDHRWSSCDSNIRVLWYMLHAALEDEENQKKGMVHLASNLHEGIGMSSHRCYNRKLDKAVVDTVLHALPVRFVGIHCIVKRPIFMRMHSPTYLYLIGKNLRARFINHDRDNRDDLAAFGISKEKLPNEAGGYLDWRFSTWVKERQALEEEFMNT